MFPYLTEPGVGLLVLFAWALTAAFVLHDISKYSDKAWEKVNESKLVWQVVGGAVAWPVGAVVYFLVLRPRLEALVEEDRKELWMQEYAERQAAAAHAAASQGVAASGGNPTPPASAAAPAQPAAVTDVTHDVAEAWTDPSDEVLAKAEVPSDTDEALEPDSDDEPYDQEKDN